MEFNFKGKSVIVTGAFRSIGKAIAAEFARGVAKEHTCKLQKQA